MRPLKFLPILFALALCACSTAAPPEARDLAAAPPASPAQAGAVPDNDVPRPAIPTSTVLSDGAEVDYSCTTDADCTVKDVGNCCGYYPACVNVDSPTFPERVKAQCEAEGMSSICGFPEIGSCMCKAGRCGAGPPTQVE